MIANPGTRNSGYGAVAGVLFACLFAAQAAGIALSPVLAQVAHDVNVSTALAGQLRTVAGLSASLTALAFARFGAPLSLRAALIAGSLLLAAGSLASAAAPNFATLAAAQVPVGAAIATLTTGGTLAAAEWVSPDHRGTTLSWALIGQPAAWIIGMPLFGVVGEQSWRYTWLVLPFVMALVAGAAVAVRGTRATVAPPPPSMHAALASPGIARWLLAELLANAAWAGTLVYSGSLFVESYGISSALTGALLAVGAAAYVSGNLTFARISTGDPMNLLVRLSAALAVSTMLFGAVRPVLATSLVLFSIAAWVSGGRTLISSMFGLSMTPEVRQAAMALRAASMQFGYFIGTFAAGVALGVGGYAAFGATIGALFLSSALVLRYFTIDHGVAAPLA